MLYYSSVIPSSGQIQQRITFSGALRTTTLLPDIDGFDDLTNTGAEQLMRIFLTGRRPDACSALEFFLQNQLHLDVVVAANNRKTLLAQAKAAQPDVILLDWDLCSRPLADLTSALHLLESQPGLILINVPAESKQAALDAGADACVVKGAPSKSLLIAIESVRLIRKERSRE